MERALALPFTVVGPAPPTPSDEDLARRAQRGDVDSFALLVTRYQRLVFRILWLRLGEAREDAEDLTQDAFLRAWEHLHQYDPGRPFKAWIAQVARNLATDRHRARARRPEDLGLDEPALDALTAPSASLSSYAGAADPQVHVEANEERRRLLGHLRDLPDHYREVLVLRFVEDLAYEDIALLLDVPLGSVKTRIFRGRELLKQRLSADCEVTP